jgi:transcriptional regulator with XRE-family HTH domain
MSTPPTDIADVFRNSLRSIREMRGLTQGELGKRAGIAAASVSHFETGQRAPSLDSLVKLADALEVSVDALLGRSPVGTTTPLDPIFLRASRANTRTLDTLRRITAALLEDTERQEGGS